MMSAIIHLSNKEKIKPIQKQTKSLSLLSNNTHSNKTCCFKIPKPIPSSSQGSGKMRCGKNIQNTFQHVAHRNKTSSYISIPVNHFHSYEGAPRGFGSAPKNNFI